MKFLSRTRFATILAITAILSFSITLLILFVSSTYSKFSFYVIAPVLSAAITLILYALIKNTAKRRNAAINFDKKHFIYSFIFLYISIESIATVMYYHTILSFAILIPA